MGGANYWESVWRRRVSRRRVLEGAAAVGTGLLGAAVVGCGDKKDDGSPSGQRTGGNVQPKPGGTLVRSFGLDAPHLDIHQTTSLVLHSFGPGSAYSRLFRYKIPPEIERGPSGLTEPDLAESVEQVDETTLVITLRPNAKFHNLPPVNGRIVTAHDVVFSYQRQLDLKANAGFLPAMASFQATGPNTLRIVLQRPDVDALSTLAYYTNKIVAPEAVGNGDLKEGPTIGTGPFILEEWRPQEVTRFRKNPEFFLPGLPYLDGHEWLRISDTAKVLASFQAGQLHVPQGLSYALVKQFERDQRFTVEFTQTGYGTSYVNFKVDAPPFNDPRVREAFFRAVNVEQVIQVALEGRGYYATGLTMPGLDWYLPEETLKELYRYDPQRAKELLAQAGQQNLTVETGFLGVIAPHQRVAEVLQDQLRAVGIMLNLVQLDNVGYAENLSVRNRFPLLVGPSSPGPNPTLDLFPRFHSQGSRNGSRISDANLDRLIERQQATFEEEERRALLAQIQRYVLDNHYQWSVGQFGSAVRWAYVNVAVHVNQGEYDQVTWAWLDK
jgi:peptide/nickel transport system substrate-binding protein